MLRLPPSTSSSELKPLAGLMVTVAPLNSSTPPLLPPGCRLSKLPAANSMLFPVPSTFHDPESIWLLGTRLRPLPPLRVSVLVATPLLPLTSTVPPLNRPACQKECPDTVMVRLPVVGKPLTLSQTAYWVPKPLGLTTRSEERRVGKEGRSRMATEK